MDFYYDLIVDFWDGYFGYGEGSTEDLETAEEIITLAKNIIKKYLRDLEVNINECFKIIEHLSSLFSEIEIWCKDAKMGDKLCCSRKIRIDGEKIKVTIDLQKLPKDLELLDKYLSD